MRTNRGPAIFPARFAVDAVAFSSQQCRATRTAGLDFQAVQNPGWAAALIDPETAAESQDYCDGQTA